MRRIHVSPSGVAKALTGTICFLVAASMAGQISALYFGRGTLFGMVNLFNLDREANVPTWYASVTLLACAVLLAFIAASKRQSRDSWWRYWAGLSAVFAYLSVDEGASIHELTIEPVRALLGTSGVLHWAWVVPGMIAVIGLGLLYLRFVLALPRSTRNLFIVAGSLFVGGALVVEMLGAGWFVQAGRRNIGYVLFWTVEEALEMAGIVVFLYALMRYIGDALGPIVLSFGGREQHAAEQTEEMDRIGV